MNNIDTDQGGSGIVMPTVAFGRYARLSESETITIETWIIEGGVSRVGF